MILKQLQRLGHCILSGRLRKQGHDSGLTVVQMVQQVSLPTVNYWKCYTGLVSIIVVLIMLWWKIIHLTEHILAPKERIFHFMELLPHVYAWKYISAFSVTFDFACTANPLWGNSLTRYDLVYSNRVSTFYLSPAWTSADASKNIIIATNQGQTVPNLMGTQLNDLL